MKGPVRFRDRTVMINHVGGKSDWEAWEGEKKTRLAFVGLKVSGDETIQKLQKMCLKNLIQWLNRIGFKYNASMCKPEVVEKSGLRRILNKELSVETER